MKKRHAGIYEIRNKTNGKTYIGSTCNTLERWRVHRYLLNNQKHHCLPLQRAWDKYGAGSFEFVILKTVESKDDLMVEEQVFIDAAKESKTAYNVSLVASGMSLQESPSDIRMSIRISEEDFAALETYCKKTGASKTGTIRMLIQILKNDQLLAILQQTLQ